MQLADRVSESAAGDISQHRVVREAGTPLGYQSFPVPASNASHRYVNLAGVALGRCHD
jgi:hypothetical protein